MRPKINLMEREWKNLEFWGHLNKAPVVALQHMWCGPLSSPPGGDHKAWSDQGGRLAKPVPVDQASRAVPVPVLASAFSEPGQDITPCGGAKKGRVADPFE